MGNYEDYLKKAALIAAGKPGGSPRERIENRVNAALDMDEAVVAARERVEAFLNAYQKDREVETDLGQSYVEQGNDRWGNQILRDIQEIATMEKKPDGSREALLLDDLLILVHKVADTRSRGRA